MPAHLRSIQRKCNHCEKPAILELRNTYNAVIGNYCRRHGNEALRDYERRHEAEEAKS